MDRLDTFAFSRLKDALDSANHLIDLLMSYRWMEVLLKAEMGPRSFYMLAARYGMEIIEAVI